VILEGRSGDLGGGARKRVEERTTARTDALGLAPPQTKSPSWAPSRHTPRILIGRPSETTCWCPLRPPSTVTNLLASSTYFPATQAMRPRERPTTAQRQAWCYCHLEAGACFGEGPVEAAGMAFDVRRSHRSRVWDGRLAVR